MEDYRFQDYAAMLRGGMDRDLLIMGNSRGKAHYDPRVLDSLLHTDSFCIGVGGYPFNIESTIGNQKLLSRMWICRLLRL